MKNPKIIILNFSKDTLRLVGHLLLVTDQSFGVSENIFIAKDHLYAFAAYYENLCVCPCKAIITHEEFLLPVEDCVLDEALGGVDDSQALEHLLEPLRM